MSEASPDKLYKKLDYSSNVKLISDFFSKSKIKASKQIYKQALFFQDSLQTRNIKLFIRQQKEMQAKGKQQQFVSKRSINLKGRYDQNQLLELQYNISKSQQKPVHIERSHTQPSQVTSNSDRKYQKIRDTNRVKTLKNLQSLDGSKIFINRPKRVTHIQANQMNRSTDNSSDNFPRIAIRKKSKSTFQQLDRKFRINDIDIRISDMSLSQQSLKKSSSSIMEFSSKNIPKKRNNLSVIHQTNNKLIQITDEKMTRYIKSLHNLINGSYDYGRSLDQQKANQMIIKRYLPLKKEGIQSQQIEMQGNLKKFQFPYLEFISESQTRKSIHRIINMSIKNTQRVVFKLLDFNKNGFIDQRDLIGLIELSQKIPDLRSDLLKIVQFVCNFEKFSISNANSMSYRQDSQRHIEKLQDIPQRYELSKTSKKQNKLNPVSISKIGYIRDRTNTFQSSQITQLVSKKKIMKKQANFGSSSFSKQKLYSFNQTKNKFFNSHKNKDQFRFTVNLQDFHKIFGNQRPSTFNDILKFLFHVKSQDMIRQIIDHNSSDSKLSKKLTKIKKEQNEGFKNYDIPQIIKDMSRKFQCHIQMSKQQDVLHINKISQKKEKKE